MEIKDDLSESHSYLNTCSNTNDNSQHKNCKNKKINVKKIILKMKIL